MILLILGLMIFLGTHSVRIYAEGWRDAQVAKFGLIAWKGIYSLVSLIGIALIVIGFGHAQVEPVFLWHPPAVLRHAAGIILVLSFVLVTAAYVPSNRIKAKIGHPMLAGVKGWAFAHLLANGTLADVILFGSFLSWAEIAFQSSRRRDRAVGAVYPVGPLSSDVTTVAVGLVVWAVFAFWLHGWLFNVRPFG